MINTIIFDLDGTLLDSVVDIKNAINHMLKKNNIKGRLSKKLLLKLLGNGSFNLVKNVLEHFHVSFSDNYLEDYLSYYKNHSLVFTKPYKGILKLLKTLKDKNFKMAICSNKDNDGVKIIYERFFKDYISFYTGTIPQMPIKPDKFLVNLCLESLSAKLNETVYIGDTEVDFLTAKNSELKFICCLWGFRSKQFLETYGIKTYAKKPKEIIKQLSVIKY